ncbi:MAG: hypothetical protein B6I37_06680 [Desulfobacteraceae bacterium 4572_35.2]|jgi:amino acid transporter|nr:MAG: hypothetical protein B6I37_06680 [Desulfobacteraceae bacterium 4572_35.2]
MKCYSVVAVIMLVFFVYIVSVLVPLPWYLYLPFVAIFVIVYQGDRFTCQFMKIPHLFRHNLLQRKQRRSEKIDGKRM